MATKKKTTKKPSAKASAKAAAPAVPGEMTTEQAQAIVDGNATGDITKAREVLKGNG